MAEPIQRAVSISNALINGVATADQIRRVGRGLANRYRRLAEYDGADDTGKAQIFCDSILKMCLEATQDLEAKTAVANAGDMARLQVNADFQPAP